MYYQYFNVQVYFMMVAVSLLNPEGVELVDREGWWHASFVEILVCFSLLFLFVKPQLCDSVAVSRVFLQK
jgi:hypothetical protein